MGRSKSKSIFVCQSCGAQRPRWEGRCSDCGEWNSLVEEKPFKESDHARGWAIGSSQSPTGSSHKTVKTSQAVKEITVERLKTGLTELDRVLGGGAVAGSFALLGGDPGIGKSTLLLQMSGGLASHGHDVLYISAEESVQQTALRAQRLGVSSERVEIGSESNLETVLELTERTQPKVLIVDSIQTVFLPEVTSAPGSVSQVRESAARLMALAKNKNITVFLIGHITKEGELAGPKVLEHMVDTVLSFEGDGNHQFRLLRSLKNRFGAAQELGVFEMSSSGLSDVKNPSELFLRDRESEAQGSAVMASIEGTRPMLCEIQALTVRSYTTLPRRTALGIDHNRLHLNLAVLDRFAGTNFSQKDVFINIAGGLKIREPAIDLSICASLLSSENASALPGNSVFFGEVGLTGEIRGVSFPDIRLKEAHKLGFTKFFIPEANRKTVEKECEDNIRKNATYLKSVNDLIALLPQKKKGRKKNPSPIQHLDH